MALVDQIRASILNGESGPGTVLSQTDLAAAHGVSRIPVRDALQALAAEKIVEILPGKGARVITLSADELDEIFDLRTLLECDLLRRATALADAKAHAEAEYMLQKSSLEAERPGWHAGDWDFHRTLYLPAGRPRQLSIVEELRTSCVVHAAGYAGLASETQQWLEDHRRMVQAYVNGAADEACKLLHSHIIAARNALTSVAM
ncbi:GntR family transcriptional regulator [Neorhizobium sp. JUb45]|uniref:GntR family transcriptional regulator n=1 Tax=unclassified Neorhizobium TaxID=2629175 RepID=UPI0010482B45|nr:GntR family transcriptional regulator [Neorhizobium sp. JUb45]TCQ99985.1 GntR family transcriptional regulator [Neorhizobium sp. JUb45]